MAINIQYAPPATLVGAAAYQAGLGDYTNRFLPEQALREQAMALQEAQFAEQQQQNQFKNQFAVDQLGLEQLNRDRAFGADRIDSARALGFRYDALDQEAAQRQQYNQMQMSEAQMRQQGQREQQQMLLQRDRAQMLQQAERDRLQRLSQQAAADWQAIQKTMVDGGFLNEQQYNQAVETWRNNYEQLEAPPPVEMPFNEPQIPPKLGEFYEEYGIPFDEQTGEPLVPENVMNQIVQARNQREIAEQNNQAKLQQEQMKQFNEAVEEQDEMEQKQQEQEAKQQQERITAQKKFAESIASDYESVMRRWDPTTGDAAPRTDFYMVPEGIHLDSWTAERLRKLGLLKSGKVYIVDGEPLEAP